MIIASASQMERRIRRLVYEGAPVLLVAAIVGCGSDDAAGGGDGDREEHAPAPSERTAGGGAARAPLEGDVTVLVVDRTTDLPIDGAKVSVGSATTVTDERGLGALDTGDARPVTVVVEADGYA